MSTNKTQNYELHSWLPQDEFHVAEINENFAALDGAVAGKADAATVSALDAAMGAAQSLLAAYNVTGAIATYGAAQTIDLGFTPKLVVIFCPASYATFFVTPVGATFQVCRSQSTSETGFNYFNLMSIVENGFQIQQDAYYFWPTTAKPAHYIAFR